MVNTHFWLNYNELTHVAHLFLSCDSSASNIDGYVFECHLTNGAVVIIDANQVGEVKPLHIGEPEEQQQQHEHKDGPPPAIPYKVVCPSIVFEIFPDNGKAL
jgi:hypothetical protein